MTQDNKVVSIDPEAGSEQGMEFCELVGNLVSTGSGTEDEYLSARENLVAFIGAHCAQQVAAALKVADRRIIAKDALNMEHLNTIIDLRAQLAAREAMGVVYTAEAVSKLIDDALAARIEPEPVAWVRRHPDGALTAEFLEDAAIEPVRKNSGAWVPLYRSPPIAQPAPSVPELSRLDQECLRIGQEMRRVAGVMPEGWTMEIHVERGYGGVIAYDEAHDQKLACDAGECDGMSYAISNVLDSAISAAAPKQNDGGE